MKRYYRKENKDLYDRKLERYIFVRTVAKFCTMPPLFR